MAHYHNHRVNGMGYREYAFDYIVTQGNTDLDDITSEMYYEFKMSDSAIKTLAMGIIHNTSGLRDAIIAEIDCRYETRRLNSLPWQNHPATQAQIDYLNILEVEVDGGLTKGEASQLIDAAKNGTPGSVNSFHNDGSN